MAKGLMGGLFGVSEWIMKFSLGNLQWALFNLPVGLLLLSLLSLENSDLGFYLLFPLGLLTPFVFFPATAALFAKAREWVKKEEEGNREQSYFSYYKENYFKSMTGGLVFVLLWSVLAADIYYFSTRNSFLMNAFLIMGILLFVWTINFLCVLVHYDMKLLKVIKHSFVITIGSPILFAAIVICSGIILMISLYIFPLIIPLFTGSIIAFLTFSAFYRVHLKITTSEQ
ncbi:YesL family protein [Halobacillus sp. Marseille-Q1614]|uniref:YesL family protein n=1 Tax=Halobacillus sp. Marseille-Q1614 TaxID=2709134 RepID=UPI0020C2AA30|nr:DUF624 domain-containing protein [Halobacillus sp. Marseille-Q1614]